MKYYLPLLILLFIVPASSGAESRAAAVPQNSAAETIDLGAGEAMLPVVAKDQRRPGVGTTECCGDEAEPPPDPGGGGYTIGACNCKRLCNGGTTCLLTQSNEQCKSKTGQPCESCVNTNCL
jgi:hypothetical protein